MILLFLLSLIMYTDAILRELIAMPKAIIDAPKLVKESRATFIKKGFTMSSIDDKYSFNGFITQNRVFTENFSVGLVYNPKNEKGSIVLLRVNGAHGGTDIDSHHAHCHIHTATAERINSGLKPEGHIEITTAYAMLEDAIQFYLDTIGLSIADRNKHFPRPERDLFTGIG